MLQTPRSWVSLIQLAATSKGARIPYRGTISISLTWPHYKPFWHIFIFTTHLGKFRFNLVNSLIGLVFSWWLFTVKNPSHFIYKQSFNDTQGKLMLLKWILRKEKQQQCLHLWIFWLENIRWGMEWQFILASRFSPYAGELSRTASVWTRPEFSLSPVTRLSHQKWYRRESFLFLTVDLMLQNAEHPPHLFHRKE